MHINQFLRSIMYRMNSQKAFLSPGQFTWARHYNARSAQCLALALHFSSTPLSLMICSSLSTIFGVFCLRKKRARNSSWLRRWSTMRVNLRSWRSSATTPFPMLSSELATLSTSSMIWKAIPTLFMHSVSLPTASSSIPITAPIIFTSIRSSPPVLRDVSFMQSSVDGSSALLVDLWFFMSRPCPMWQSVISLRYISFMRHLSSGVGRVAMSLWTGRKYMRLAALIAESIPKTVCVQGFPLRCTESSSMSSMMRLAQ